MPLLTMEFTQQDQMVLFERTKLKKLWETITHKTKLNPLPMNFFGIKTKTQLELKKITQETNAALKKLR